MKNNIILIGMMGAGKTSVGRLLNDSLHEFSFIDLDYKIEQQENKTITEIFELFGEHYFRKLETNLIKEVCKNKNQIISLGGGAFEKEENRTVLKQNSLIIYLKASPAMIFERIKTQTHRPLLKKGFNEQNITLLLNQREKNYLLADIVIDTNSKPFYNIVNEILERVKNVL